MTEVAINDVGLRKWLQKVWGMAGLGAVVIFATSLITPDVAPVMPSALGETPAIPPYQSEASLSEFTARPLFVATRRPWQEPVAPAATAEPQTVIIKDPAEISGLELLGVFSSGDTRGAILEKDTGDRSRVLVGEKIREWTLIKVESRSAVFRNNAGEAKLDMMLASGPGNYVKNVASESSAETEVDDSERNFVPSFENMYAAKRLARNRGAQQDGESAAEQSQSEADE